MGSEDLFHKRKARNAEELQRAKGKRAQNRRYLIVCEGTKTEPNYLNDLLIDHGISPYIAKIAKNNGSSPASIVQHALDLYETDAMSGDHFDKVYCVFDRDSHETFHDAVARTRDLSNVGKPFFAITSTPCFEFWLILHFGYSNQPYHAAGKKSVGDQAVTRLRSKAGFARYDKGNAGVYEMLKDRIDEAIANAKTLRNQADKQERSNPYTNVDELIEDLISLKT